jgi:hypothetical protein
VLLANFAVDVRHGWNAGDAARKSKCVRDGTGRAMRLRKENMSVRLGAKQSDGDGTEDRSGACRPVYATRHVAASLFGVANANNEIWVSFTSDATSIPSSF